MTSFTVETAEVFMLVLARMTAFVCTAPFFSQSSIPRKGKVCLSVVLAVVVFESLENKSYKTESMIGYVGLILIEAICGLLLGLACSLCTMILAFAGNIIDMEIGFSMVQGLDPTTKIQTTITGNLYMYFVMLIMLVTDVHLYIVSAIVDSFKYIGLGKAKISFDMYKILEKFIQSYFVTAFRIVLPIFAVMLLTNVVLGILAKVASQMNLFVIGMQLKIIFGLVVMIFIAGALPMVANFIFEEMKEMLRVFIKAMM